MLRAQVKELKGAPADQVVRVSRLDMEHFFHPTDVQVDEKKKRAAEDAA